MPENIPNMPDWQKLEKDCLLYFKEHKVFAKLLSGFREKYASYGTFAGTIVLKHLTEQETEDLEGFFQKNFHRQTSISISAARFEKALKESRFSEISPKTLLELYFGVEMSGKKEQKKQARKQRVQVLAEVSEKYMQTPAEAWLKECGDGHFPAENLSELRRLLNLGAQMINSFPFREGRTEYLAVFAARLTGNPHAFDAKAKDGVLLHQLVHWVLGKQGIVTDPTDLFPALSKKREYLAAGILLDDISNYVMLSMVRAKQKNGQPHAGMEGFFSEGDMLHVPLSVLAGWECAECPGNEIYIMENPSVYALFSGKWKGQKAAMCMNGQPRLSSILMLDLLAKSDTKIYYAGDFDPEGILIAQKLKQYYPGEFVFWHMSMEEYTRSISKEEISAKRLKMLEKITDRELLCLADEIGRQKRAGYQENIWNEFT